MLESTTSGGANKAPLETDGPIYKQCPNCGAPIELPPIHLRKALGATLWSDGYLESPGLPEPPILGKCRVCEAIGCLAELPTIEPARQSADGVDYAFVPLTLADYSVLLDNLEDISRDFHLYLRMKFWQLNNHRRRGIDEAIPLSEVERANLTALLELLDERDPSRLMKVEVLRQLQEFEIAKAKIHDIIKVNIDEQLAPIAEKLRQLITDHNAGVAKIFSDESGPSNNPG